MSRYRKSRRNWRPLLFVGALVVVGFGVYSFMGSDEGEEAIVESHETKPQPKVETAEAALAILNDTTPNRWEVSMDSMPDGGCVKLKINGLGGPLAKVFNDSNKVHYAEAERYGIAPIHDERGLLHLRNSMTRIVSTPEYYVAELKHSYPFLVPEAAARLKEVGQRFNDSLAARGGGDYRLKVTSLLRTSGSVKRLRRVNSASVDSSVHRFGTTFDISYTRFMLDREGGVYRTQEDLKNLLAEVLYAMREEGKVYVKYERSSGCFHITARKES